MLTAELRRFRTHPLNRQGTQTAASTRTRILGRARATSKVFEGLIAMKRKQPRMPMPSTKLHETSSSVDQALVDRDKLVDA